jgi:hypothetical protein
MTILKETGERPQKRNRLFDQPPSASHSHPDTVLAASFATERLAKKFKGVSID